jgi:hypothetical protein
MKVDSLKAAFYLGAIMNWYQHFQNVMSCWAEILISDLHVILLSICAVLENRRMETSPCLMK